MYCPRCAAQNLEGTKFCRTCGTNLEVVALALTDSSPVEKANNKKIVSSKTGKTWIKKRSEGMKNLIQGVGLLSASALLAAMLGIFSNNPDWIVIWLVLVGWMAVLGVVTVGSGIGDLIEARFLLRLIKEPLAEVRPTSADLPALVAEPVTSSNLSIPASVTENTTNLLINPPAAAKKID